MHQETREKSNFSPMKALKTFSDLHSFPYTKYSKRVSERSFGRSVEYCYGCRYRAVTSAYYRGALGAMLVYDITKRQTFDHVTRWLEELRAHADNSIVVMLLGNKADLASKRAVSEEDAVEFAEEQGLFFAETSALSGENVETAFLMLIEEMHGVVSRKALEYGGGRRDGASEVLVLKGTEVSVLLSEDPMMETSAMKKGSSCACY